MRRFLIATTIVATLAGFVWLAVQDTIAAGPAGPADTCKGMPAYLAGYNMLQPEFDTSRRDQPGLVLSDSANPEREAVQEPSWRQFGNLGPIARDEKGAVFTASVPVINTLSTKKDSHLAVLRVDPASGKLEHWLTLAGNPADTRNYYGITALAYDCATRLLYAAAIAGSSKDTERGFIAAIDTVRKAEVFRYEGIDALGLGIFGGKKGRHLYVGSARSATIARIPLAESGKPFGAVEQVVQFDPFNRSHARKLVFTSDSMDIQTTQFYFNLIASTEFDQQHIRYQYDSSADAFRRQ